MLAIVRFTVMVAAEPMFPFHKFITSFQRALLGRFGTITVFDFAVNLVLFATLFKMPAELLTPCLWSPKITILEMPRMRLKRRST